MASRPLESPECRAFECLFPRSWSSFTVRAMLAQTSRIAVYGPVRTVVWEGSAGDRRPYPDQCLLCLQRHSRHTCALNVLQATGDIRKVALWLGHENTQTTEEYLRVD